MYIYVYTCIYVYTYVYIYIDIFTSRFVFFSFQIFVLSLQLTVRDHTVSSQMEKPSVKSKSKRRSVTFLGHIVECRRNEYRTLNILPSLILLFLCFFPSLYKYVYIYTSVRIYIYLLFYGLCTCIYI